MTVEPDASSPAYQELSCNVLVYRLAGKKRWVDYENGRLTIAAFLRRQPVSDTDRGDEDGLSVNPTHTCTLDEAKTMLGTVHGVATLHVGRIRDIGLDVIQDEPQHALLKGAPYEGDEPAFLNKIAGALSDQSRLVWAKSKQ